MPTLRKQRRRPAPNRVDVSPPAVDPHTSEPGRAHTSLLRPLGIVGYDAVEPALLAALATEEPLLLLSDHGAAKTLLLVRLAEALGLELRHYNASILQFDDLAGFPVPDERGGIRYASPPGAVWDADAVFFDEIGRCRPETANKLFPIVHERRIQGIALERLRFRWAATNPPPEAMNDTDGGSALDWMRNEGVEALDPALADRFSYVVPLTRFSDLSDADRARVVAGAGERAAPDAGPHVRELVESARALLPTLEELVGAHATAYVLALAPRLALAGLAAGGRRAATLRRNVIAVRAACLALGRAGDERACFAALLASIPDITRRPVPRAILLAAHQAAWKETSMSNTDPCRALLAVRDPMRRAVLALTLPELRADLRGEALCGALSELPGHEAEILAWHLLPRVLGGTVVPATAIESVAEVVGRVAKGGDAVRGFGTQLQWTRDLRTSLAQSALPEQELEYVHSACVRAFQLPQSVTGLWPARSANELASRALDFRSRCVAALGAHLDRAVETAEER